MGHESLLLLQDIVHVVDGQRELGQGEKRGEIGRVEGGQDGNKDPPGGEYQSRRVSGGRQNTALSHQSSVDKPDAVRHRVHLLLPIASHLVPNYNEQVDDGPNKHQRDQDEDPHLIVERGQQSVSCTKYRGDNRFQTGVKRFIQETIQLQT